MIIEKFLKSLDDCIITNSDFCVISVRILTFLSVEKDMFVVRFQRYLWSIERNFLMKILFHSLPVSWDLVEEDFSSTSTKAALEKTRFALDMAYAGFNDAVNPDLIDSYIYEINSLQKKPPVTRNGR